MIALLVAAPIATSMQMLRIEAPTTTAMAKAIPCNSPMGDIHAMSGMNAGPETPAGEAVDASSDDGSSPAMAQHAKSMSGCGCTPWCQFAAVASVDEVAAWGIDASPPALARPVSAETADPKPMFKPPKA